MLMISRIFLLLQNGSLSSSVLRATLSWKQKSMKNAFKWLDHQARIWIQIMKTCSITVMINIKWFKQIFKGWVNLANQCSNRWLKHRLIMIPLISTIVITVFPVFIWRKQQLYGPISFVNTGTTVIEVPKESYFWRLKTLVKGCILFNFAFFSMHCIFFKSIQSIRIWNWKCNFTL